MDNAFTRMAKAKEGSEQTMQVPMTMAICLCGSPIAKLEMPGAPAEYVHMLTQKAECAT
jgi:hypothetical protein